MEAEILKVLEFQKGVNAPQPEVPTMLPIERAKLRQDLLQEEVTEIATAVWDWYHPSEEPRFKTEQEAITEVLDGLVDSLYIIFGTAIEYGLADRLVFAFNEVHRSNMTKFGDNGTAVFREDGKLLKPETYRRPNLSQIVKKDMRAFKDMKFLSETVKEEQTEFLKKVDNTIHDLMPVEWKIVWKTLQDAQDKLAEANVLQVNYDFSDLLNGRRATVVIDGVKTVIKENGNLAD